MVILSENDCQNFLSPSEKGCTRKRKNLFPLERFGVQENKKKITEVVALVETLAVPLNGPSHEIKMACMPSEDSDQPGHPPSLIRVFAVRMKKAWVLSYPLSAQWRLWSDWADVQADLCLRWAHIHFLGFEMKWLLCDNKSIRLRFYF